MAVPAEPAGDVPAVHGLVAGDDVFDGAGEDVAVVGLAGGEGGTIVEDVLGVRFGSLQLGLQCLDRLP